MPAQCQRTVPAQLEAFIDTVAAGRALGSIKRRFCFALDDVLLCEPSGRLLRRAASVMQPQGCDAT
ncbi:hypothetical protein EMIHUDRAFT_214782 [Emiliania huxleyi CCMP1516]|uniref:Uncharacterized protein n=2 Tax=Emiliania huxleyi TaxID=2903 RepID=A0A0D3IJH6_EMIH1|nr:hypothetical protein EMIHUDRAFT_214782 [Emiliania huxleyi CCMP1516]EOD11411.1 hypothetical protein EMIHUDRAFT_214782 [Emiliania huxleyi CCMP1516]|eukprot:XP_005763840.1 hypothetical protein EMIHUDRAFT_214782 [Emiliania huxleyi CCMP1516]